MAESGRRDLFTHAADDFDLIAASQAKLDGSAFDLVFNDNAAQRLLILADHRRCGHRQHAPASVQFDGGSGVHAVTEFSRSISQVNDRFALWSTGFPLE